MGLQDRTVLISGGSREVGPAIAFRAARDGADIVMPATSSSMGRCCAGRGPLTFPSTRRTRGDAVLTSASILPDDVSACSDAHPPRL